eukprot:10092687-Lingulodinium_polyedra.AAC.1
MSCESAGPLARMLLAGAPRAEASRIPSSHSAARCGASHGGAPSAPGKRSWARTKPRRTANEWPFGSRLPSRSVRRLQARCQSRLLRC